MFCSHMTLVTWFAYLSSHTIYYLDPIVYLDVVDQMFKCVGNYSLLGALITLCDFLQW